VNKWINIWNKEKGIEDKLSTLQRLIFLDGFDSETGRISEQIWLNYVQEITYRLEIKENDSIYDVGCGSGAFLYPFYQKGHDVGGIDYSETLIKYAQNAMSSTALLNNEAINLDIENKYDYVISNSVFFYFNNLEYAKRVIEKMIIKANKKIAIFDIPDLAKKNESEKYRRSTLPEGEYEAKYEDLAHLYYEKEWFINITESFGHKIEIFDQIIENYGNNKFRFNVIISKG